MTDRDKEICRLYPDTPIREIAQITGVCAHTVKNIARRYGVKRSERYNETLRKQKIENLNTTQARKNHREAMRRIFRMESFRVKSGMKQKTKYHIATVPKKSIIMAAFLCHKYHYYRCEGELLTLLYDENTIRRMPPNLDKRYLYADEAYYTKRYGIQFYHVDTD